MKKLFFTILAYLLLNASVFAYTKPNISNLNFFKKKTQQILVPEISPQESLRNDAIAFYNTNDIDNAYLLLQKIPKEQLNETDYLLMANIMQDKEKIADASIYLQKSLEINPKFYKAYYNLGYIAQSDGKNDTAIKYYKKAIRYNKNFAFSYYNAGICYARKQEFKTARFYFNRAILRKNDVPDFYFNLAYVYKKLGDEKKAAKALTVYNNLVNR